MLVTLGLLMAADQLDRMSFSRTWPVLLILLGLFKLRLHAVRGFSGWLPGSRIELGGLDIFGESYDYPLSAEKASGKAPRVIIETFRGNARITTGDVSSVKVTGHSTIRSLDQSSADRTN